MKLDHIFRFESSENQACEGDGVMRLTREITNNTFFVKERVVAPQENNVYFLEEGQATFYVIQGKIVVRLQRGDDFTAQQGDILHFPARSSFSYGNREQLPARVLELVFPAVSTEYFQHIKAVDGRCLGVITDVGIFKLTGEQTKGEYLLMEWSVPPGGGVALHTQSGMETFYILSGSFVFRGLNVIGELYTLSTEPGDILHVPVRVSHAYHNSGKQPGRMLVLMTPAGRSAEFFEEIGLPVAHATAFPNPPFVPDPGVLTDLLKRYQVNILS